MRNAEGQEQHNPGSTTEYLRVVRERAWVIILAVVIVVGAALALSYTSTPLYRASSKLVYQTNNLDRTLFGAQVFADTNQPRDVETAAELIKLPQVAEGVKTQLNSSRSAGELLGMISVTPFDHHQPHPDRRRQLRPAGSGRCRQRLRRTVRHPPPEHRQGHRRGCPGAGEAAT